MRKTTFFLLCLLLSCSYIHSQKTVLSNESSISMEQNRILQKSFDEYRVVEIDLAKFKEDISTLKETRVIWRMDENTKYDMKIYPTEIRSPSYKGTIVSENGAIVQEKGEIVTYKGSLTSGNSVRLTIDDDFIYGGIETDDGLLMIQQLRYLLNDKTIPHGKLVVYKSDKVKGEEGICGTPDVSVKSEQNESTVTKSGTSSGCRIIEVALDCDTEYWNSHNDNSINMMLGEINLIQEVYEDDLDALLSVTSAHVFIGGAYSSTNGSAIINEIQNLWSSSPYSSISRDLVHHFTGKNTTYAGEASRVAATCDDPNPVCWTKDRTNAHQTMAHEIGHLLNGQHSDGTNCGTEYVRSIMCQGANKQLSFSAASITSITNHMNNWSCLDANSANIIGTSPICVNQTKTYDLIDLPVNSTSITWSLNNSKASIISGQGTESVDVRGNSSGSVTLKATIDYEGTICGTVVETKSLQIGPSISFYWTPSSTSGSLDVTVFGGQPPWTFYKNGSLIHTAYTSTTTVPFGCSSGTLQVQSTNSCGTATYTVSVSGSCSRGYYAFTASPNPATTEINVSSVEQGKRAATTNAPGLEIDNGSGDFVLTLLDFTGNLVKEIRHNRKTKDMKMDVSTLSKGVYFLNIVGKDVDETHKMIIE